MGLKKYEIITVGSDRRVRALRSWQVGDRYVNIGDVGGIVYDEKTLSQDGACWLFRGNFGFPGARIGGDSIVDVGEATLSTAGTPAVDILGSSVVVGGMLRFVSGLTAADAVVLTAADFEQGGFNYAAGVNWETMKATSDSYIRSKALMFSGGTPVTVKCAVGGYAVTWYTTDADGITTGAAASQIVTGAGVSFTVPAGQYFFIRLRKEPTGTIVPAGATAAKITFTGTYETKLSVIDSRVEINPATSTGVATVRPGGTIPGAPYPESIIRNARVSINIPAANRDIRIMGRIIGSNAAIDATGGDAQLVGIYSNVKNIAASGVLSTGLSRSVHDSIQVTDCDNFAVSPTIFPGFAASQIASQPFIFQGCNVPGGRFYHHAQIANTYKNIDFALAQSDLGKAIASGEILASSEVEGMYRLYSTTGSLFGGLVEGYDSVKSLNMAGTAGSYGTTIYADAYLNGIFDIAGTNVFGNTKKHDTSNAQDVSGVLAKGLFNATTNGSTISGVVANNARAVVSQPFRVSGAGGVSVSSPAGVECNIYLTDATNKILVNTGYVSGTSAPIVPALPAVYAYVAVKKTDGSDILSTDEFKGVTVTTYNGCKIVNTGATAVSMKGNIRVEDNAILVNASVTGTGYFGENSVVYYNPAVWASLDLTGTAHMKDNAVFAPTAITGACALVHMQDNAKFIGSVTRPSTGLSFIMANNAIIEGISNTRSGVVMYGNSKVTATGQIASGCCGVLVMTDNASIEAHTTVIGAITLAGNYKGNVIKTWIGKRTITDVNEPEYDNNVKSKYDL
jgi:hypothetical protein